MSIPFKAAFYDRREAERSVVRRIEELETKLKILTEERDHASDMIVEIVSALGDGKSVKIQDRYGNSVVASEVKP